MKKSNSGFAVREVVKYEHICPYCGEETVIDNVHEFNKSIIECVECNKQYLVCEDLEYYNED